MRVFSEAVHRKHYAGIVSRASFVQLVLWTFLIIFPYFVAYATNNFWVRESTYTEQPRVLFKQKYIYVAQGKSQGNTFVFSSSDTVNQLNSGYLRAPEAVSNDSNVDSKPENIELKFTLPLSNNEEIHQVSILLLFEVTLQDKARILMEGAAFIETGSFLGGQSVYVDGDLMLKQANPFPANTVRNVAAASILDSSAVQSIEDCTFPKLLRAYASRNDTTVFKQYYSTWTPGNADSFETKINVRIPAQVIRYKPNFLETIKFAWIQYLALFWATWFFVSIARGFIFREQIVPTRVVWETKSKDQ